jgi:hypothetical protein
MDIDLKSFGLTIAVGLCVAIVVYLTAWVCWNAKAKSARRLVFRQQPGSAVIPAAVIGVIALGLGIVAEDLSKNALANRTPAVLGPQFRFLMGLESFHRATVLARSERAGSDAREGQASHVDTSKCANGISGKRNNGKVEFRLSDMGVRVVTLLHELAEAKMSMPLELQLHARMERDLISWHGAYLFANPLRRLMPEALVNFAERAVGYDGRAEAIDRIEYLHERGYRTDCASYLDALDDLYYLAKNISYQSDNHFTELEDIRMRYVFVRSIVFVAMIGIYLIIYAMLAKSAFQMWRDVGILKTVVSVLIFIALCASLFDLVWSPGWGLGADAGLEADASWPQLAAALQFLAPAAFLWVCLYRLRRMWKMLPTAIERSWKSAVAGPKLLKSDREREACRGLVAVVLLLAVMFPVRLAYQADQNNYVMRVFGYYETTRGKDLKCRYGTGRIHCDEQTDRKPAAPATDGVAAAAKTGTTPVAEKSGDTGR